MSTFPIVASCQKFWITSDPGASKEYLLTQSSLAQRMVSVFSLVSTQAAPDQAYFENDVNLKRKKEISEKKVLTTQSTEKGFGMERN